MPIPILTSHSSLEKTKVLEHLLVGALAMASTSLGALAMASTSLGTALMPL